MSRINIDISKMEIEVSDFIKLNDAVDFVIAGANDKKCTLELNTLSGVTVFRINSFENNGDVLSVRVTLASEGLQNAFLGVPEQGNRKFMVHIHNRNASYELIFRKELILWKSVSGAFDMSQYALKSEIPVLPDMSVYALKTDLSGYASVNHTHTLSSLSDLASLSDNFAAKTHSHVYNSLTGTPDLSIYALKSEAFSGKYADLSGAPDLSVYALKTNIDLSISELKTKIENHTHTLSSLSDLSKLSDDFAAKNHSHAYSSLTGTPDLSIYALKSELPEGADLSIYVKTNDLPDFSTFATMDDLPEEVDLSVYALKTDLNQYLLKSELPNGTGLCIKGAYDNSTTYKRTDDALDGVQYGGSLWGYTAETESSGNPPPDSPETSNDYWTLLVAKGEPGVTFTPSVSEDGFISWTNNGNLSNPQPVSIKGPSGTGINPKGLWDSSTTYAKNDMVRGNNATWVSKSDGNTGNSLPSLPVEENEFWFLSQKDGSIISGVSKTGTEGLVDTYTLTTSQGTSFTFTVTNGLPGAQGTPGSTGITLGIIKSYDSETGTVSVQDANDDWTENTSGTLHENIVVP